MNKTEPLFIIKNHFHFLFCELPIHGCCQFFFLIIKGSLHMKGISSMNVLYVSNIFSHFVVSQNYLISLTLLIFFYYEFRILCSTPSSVSIQGDCPALPGFPSLHFGLEIGPASKLGNLRVHPGAELLGPRVCVYSALAVRKLSQGVPGWHSG